MATWLMNYAECKNCGFTIFQIDDGDWFHDSDDDPYCETEAIVVAQPVRCTIRTVEL